LHLKDISLSFVPASGTLDDYDHHISFDENHYFGFEMKDVIYEGNGTIIHGDKEGEGEPFTFSGPIE